MRDSLAAMKPHVRQPALFVGHGSPINALDANRFTSRLKEFGQSLSHPEAILCISAHWVTDGVQIGMQARPKTLHDFYGFPKPLYQIKYPSLGAPQKGARLLELLKPFKAQAASEWGFDHGVWSVLLHLFPKADVPVFQLSLDRNLTFAQHLEIGRSLAPLREEGIMLIGSGNIVHNLSRLENEFDAIPSDWAIAFDAEVRECLLERDFSHLTNISYETSQLLRLAHPTTEHLLPLFYIAGASLAVDDLNFIYEGFHFGSLSMRTFTFTS